MERSTAFDWITESTSATQSSNWRAEWIILSSTKRYNDNYWLYYSFVIWLCIDFISLHII